MSRRLKRLSLTAAAPIRSKPSSEDASAKPEKKRKTNDAETAPKDSTSEVADHDTNMDATGTKRGHDVACCSASSGELREQLEQAKSERNANKCKALKAQLVAAEAAEAEAKAKAAAARKKARIGELDQQIGAAYAKEDFDLAIELEEEMKQLSA